MQSFLHDWTILAVKVASSQELDLTHIHGYRNSKTHTRDYSTPDHYNASDAVHVMEALNTRFSIVGWCEDGVRGVITAALFPEWLRNCLIGVPKCK